MSVNPNIPPPNGFGPLLMEWLVANVQLNKRRINALAAIIASSGGGGGGSVNIYNSNGTLTGPRSVAGNGFGLAFNNMGSFYLAIDSSDDFQFNNNDFQINLQGNVNLSMDGVSKNIISRADTFYYSNTTFSVNHIIAMNALSTTNKWPDQDGTLMAKIIGTGSPEGVVTANKGTIYLNTSGTTAVYFNKRTGVGNTGWVSFTPVSLYDENGALTSNRTIDASTFTFNITNLASFNLSTGGSTLALDPSFYSVDIAGSTALYLDGVNRFEMESSTFKFFSDILGRIHNISLGTVDTNNIFPDQDGTLMAKLYGTGSPEGVVTASKTAIYADQASGLYYTKTTAGGNTGWQLMSADGIGTVTNVSGTLNRIVVTSGSTTPGIDIDPGYVGQTSITTVGTIGTGVWNGTPIDLATYVAGNLSVAHLNSGTNANIQTFWRGDGSWNTAVTDVSFVNTSGFTGTVTSGTTTPAIRVGTSVVGILKGDGASVSAATECTDYISPSGTCTLFNKTIVKRVVQVADATTFTPTNGTADINYQINTQTSGTTLTFNAPSGTLYDGQDIILRITSTNTHTLSWNAIYAGCTTIALPLYVSGQGKTDVFEFRYNAITSKWHITIANYGY